MRILLTVNSAWNVLNFRRGLVESLLAAGHSVTVLAPDEDDAAGLIQEMGCAWVPLAMQRSGTSVYRDGRLLLDFYRQFRAQRPHVVLSFTIKNNIYGAVAAQWLGIPFIPNVTGLGTVFLSGKWIRTVAAAAYRVAFRRLALVLFQNEDDLRLFEDLGLIRPGVGQLLPGSGINLHEFVPSNRESDPKLFLFIGRILKDKGVLELVEASRLARAVDPEIKVAIVGRLGADNRSAIGPKQMDAWVQEGVVTYLGPSRDVRNAIAGAACIVLPSYREGAPRVLIEAAAMAKPAIATDVPGCRSVVEHGRTGLLCRVKDADDLAAKMLKMASLPPPLRVAMGDAARRKVEQEFDEAIVVGAYFDAIAKMGLPGASSYPMGR